MSRSIAVALAFVTVVACGGKSKSSPTSTPIQPEMLWPLDRILPLFPDGAQVILEIDLKRLRTNPIVGPLVIAALNGGASDKLPGSFASEPIANADALVLAAYGVGTGKAATVIVLATTATVPNGVPLGDGLVALGPTEWTGQLEARAAIAGVTNGDAPKIVASKELLELRDHALPPKAPGASFRLTARLPFDARVELARELNLDTVPAELSIWADVVDDFAVIIDANAADPGDKAPKAAAKRLDRAMRAMLLGLQAEPAVKLLGLAPAIDHAKLTATSSWLRTVIVVGPDRLGRVVGRAKSLLPAKGDRPLNQVQPEPPKPPPPA
ncbi:hypothetical protein BH11MYX2_BH11MYX2_15580 [soil metagenome]